MIINMWATFVTPGEGRPLDYYNHNIVTCMFIALFLKNNYYCEWFYSQVEFHVKSTVVRVATQGGNLAYVGLYRLAYSEDCTVFHDLLDGAGNNKVNIC